MAAWTYSQWQWGERSAGALLTIAVHVVVIAWLLAMRLPESSEPAPINVAVISDTSQQQSQPLEPIAQPRLQQPTLTIPQPQIVLADTAPASAAPVAVVAAASAPTEPVASAAVSQPVFDADYLNNPAPSYPPIARRLREEGIVLVRVLVASNGLPDQIELKRSSGSLRLDEAALSTVKKWRFVPAQRGGQAVAAWVVVPIAFSLMA